MAKANGSFKEGDLLEKIINVEGNCFLDPAAANGVRMQAVLSPAPEAHQRDAEKQAAAALGCDAAAGHHP